MALLCWMCLHHSRAIRRVVWLWRGAGRTRSTLGLLWDWVSLRWRCLVWMTLVRRVRCARWAVVGMRPLIFHRRTVARIRTRSTPLKVSEVSRVSRVSLVPRVWRRSSVCRRLCPDLVAITHVRGRWQSLAARVATRISSLSSLAFPLFVFVVALTLLPYTVVKRTRSQRVSFVVVVGGRRTAC